jgi:hypothetical protein
MIGFAIALVVAVLTAVFVALFYQLFHRLTSRLEAEQFTEEWFENFSTSDYEPMQRLFNEEDFEFLASQPGYRPEIGRQLRAERREVLAGYLQLLTRDFNQLHATAKWMLVHSVEDRPDFDKGLRRQQITFYYAVTAVRLRLVLMPLGWKAPDVRKLIQPIESMRLHVQDMIPHNADAH